MLTVQLAVGLLLVGVDQAGDPAPSPAADAATGVTDAAVAAAPPPSTGLPRAAEDPAPLAPAAPDTSAPDAGQPAADPRAEAAPAEPAPAAAALPGEAAPAVDSAPLVVPEPGPPPPPSGEAPAVVAAPVPAATPGTTVAASAPAATESERIFASEFPAHAAARQRADVPSSYHWAVIVGVNDYLGRTSNTVGSVGDALVLRDTLYGRGWRGDQVLTLTDHAATHDRVVRAIEWLIRSTDERSTVVFSFSGHMRHNSGVTALWPADNRFIWAGDLGRMLGAVRADRLWVSLQGCHAAGLAAPGLQGGNRVVTYASGVHEKAYEDPARGQSVMGHFLLAEGLRGGLGDREAGNGDGRSSVQEAFAWAAPRATSRTHGQSHGPQRPVIADGLGGRQFVIEVTGAPPTAARPPARAPEARSERKAPRRRLLNLRPLLGS
ncbi:MAG TPA: caspase family protein [Egibacteraceae bacterium]|nr:caspase family protein [Egibacteraceae bacterium]